ncbi:MAG: Fic family protein [Candidatus Aenigmarchaeota archaeon]|nr:Fic family protein [Candidatus Aenigmarchaeota archaeon]
MVMIKKKVVGNQTYYYIEHSIREGSRIEKREKYIGKHVPKNIEEIKAEFLSEIYKEKWHPVFEKIKRNFSEETEAMPETAKEKETEIFSVRFTYDTQRIEGSKLTLRETADLLEKGVTPKEKPVEDVKEAEAHKSVFYMMLGHKKDLSLQTVLHWHHRIFEGTKKDIAGKIRQHQVAISGSIFLPPSPVEVYPLLREFFKWYDKNKNTIQPIEMAALVHLKFVAIHPFADGNGRLSRLMMNFILHRRGYPMLNIPYENRAGYYNALERSHIKMQDNIFVQWLFRRYAKEYRRYVK